MDHTFDFVILRVEPAGARDERINVGLAVMLKDELDLRLAKRLDKVHAIAAGLTAKSVQDATRSLSDLDRSLRDSGMSSWGDRRAILNSGGPFRFGETGHFVAQSSAAYEDRIASILRAMVEPEPAAHRPREKRTRLLTEVKAIFRQERVLAKRGEDLSSHRLVPRLDLDEGLTVDLALRNGAMHMIETVDASSDSESLRHAIGEIGVSALVLERARMRFGPDKTKTRLVYNASSAMEKLALAPLEAAQNQGAQLVNWRSAGERKAFLRDLTALAEPIPIKRKPRAATAEFGQHSLV